MNKKDINTIIKEKELMLIEGKLTAEWFESKGLNDAAKEQQESIKELQTFIDFLKERL
ncbi:MAG: hypothetical protein PHE21_04140 [Candidatus Dojkabacteria bacterium]|nr:hypothetical protein [Candidatus Dojkabacteria bacterium]